MYQSNGDLAVVDQDQQSEDSNTRSRRLLSRLLGVQPYSDTLKVLSIFLISAFAVTTARVLAPFEVGKDQSVQLETAHRLAGGMGLTTTNQANPPSFDLSERPKPGYLVQWPPGLSLLVAGFLIAGLPLLASLKIIYAAATLAGWLGWALIASRLMSTPITSFGRVLNVHFVLAATAPVFTTPLWNGTDVFLWAGTPLLVLLLVRTSTNRASYVAITGAGVLVGLLCFMRYASAFLALAAVLILIQISYPRLRLLLGHLLAFLLPSLIVVVAIAVYLQVSAHNASGLPAQLTSTSRLVVHMPARVKAIIHGSPVTSNLIFGAPWLNQAVSRINSTPVSYAVGLVCLLVIFSFPLILLRSRGSGVQKPKNDLALSLSFLPLSLTIFMILMRLLSDSALFRIKRYYEPLILCSILICYEIASRRRAPRFIRVSSIGIVALFLGYTLLFNSTLLLVPEKRGQTVQTVLGFTPAQSPYRHSTSQDIGYPSWRLYSWKESSRLKVKQLYEAYPEALFVAQEYPLYIYDMLHGGPTPGLNLIDYQGSTFLRKARVGKAVKVFWVMGSGTKVDFVRDARIKIIHSDPIEQTTIYESDFPAGYELASGQP
jgi:hypothetical protein